MVFFGSAADLKEWLMAYEEEYDRLVSLEMDPVPLPRTLNLRGNCITEEGAIALAEEIPNGIHYLDLSNNVLLADDAVMAVVQMCKKNYPQVRGYEQCNFIRSVDLRDNPLITNKSLRAIYELVLRWNAVEIKVNQSNKGMDPSLVEKINDVVNKPLEERQMIVANYILKQLKRYTHRHANIQDYLFNGLNFHFHTLDDQFIKDLCEALLENKYVERLDLSHVTTASSVAWKALAHLLRNNFVIKEVVLKASNVNNDDVKMFTDVIKHHNGVVRIYMDECLNVDEEVMNEFTKAQRNLKDRQYHFQDHLLRRHQLPVDPGFYKRLRLVQLMCKKGRLYELEGVIDFANMGVHTSELNQIVHTLNGYCNTGGIALNLVLSGNGIGNKAVQSLGEFLHKRKASRDIQRVSLEHNILMNNQGVGKLMKLLATNVGLAHLSLDDNDQLTDAAVKYVVDALYDTNPILQVSMKNCKRISEEALKRLEEANKMRYEDRKAMAAERERKKQLAELARELKALERAVKNISKGEAELTKSSRPTWNPSLPADGTKPLPKYDAIEDIYCSWTEKPMVRKQIEKIGLIESKNRQQRNKRRNNGNSNNHTTSSSSSAGHGKPRTRTLKPLRAYRFEKIKVFEGEYDAEQVAFPKKLSRRGQKKMMKRLGKTTDSLANSYD
eukprot:TRINITY_DN1741_c0_g1_i2.p1 TRINITY_DN1741_c0_g1~~TRINITY_DN1741_c0_g1_i2.p1  ORF type:complete len:669 (-),score=226.20 TRINITY_DN1741_c0_g1_i2:91-2097(-)